MLTPTHMPPLLILLAPVLHLLRALFLNKGDFSKRDPTNIEEVCLKNYEFHLGKVEMSHRREALIRKKRLRRKTSKLHL